ncbi:TetR family transcriptional regulator [Corynebacterium sp. HMSC05H05]|uniref:TetR family transcriptional regulator n=1 Tax=Corynebacterium sp. HMSC05H05 TaxID=1581119 RepID=UPI0008A2CEAF|nr:TetR family transcriptional regulator [Corynebacterium sp. HMSC05H05]OFT56627.1 TetR family transcriptional regulator [Corynebacterium sp. HMSC05H05]
MRRLSGEQLLAVADEYCAFHGCHVRSFAALAASAAVPGSRLHGVPVFDSVEAAAAALAETIRALQPLSGTNAGFAEVAAEVYRRWAE